MGWGTVIFGSHANFEEKKAALKKIYMKFGYESFTLPQAMKLLTKHEKKLINFNALKHRNAIVQAGWAPGGKLHLWKLTPSMILLCTED